MTGRRLRPAGRDSVRQLQNRGTAGHFLALRAGIGLAYLQKKVNHEGTKTRKIRSFLPANFRAFVFS
jgi:hypothetical protein